MSARYQTEFALPVMRKEREVHDARGYIVANCSTWQKAEWFVKMLNSSAQFRRALQPFAVYAEKRAEAWNRIKDDSAFYGTQEPEGNITIGDFRRARKLVEETVS